MNEYDHKKYKTLINLSGGADSVYLLYKYLMENKHVVVHHCNMKNHEGRFLAERSATNKVIKWLKDNKLETFIYFESSMDYGTIRYIVKDIEVIGFFTGVIIRDSKFNNLTEIAISANCNDESTNPNDPSVINRKKIIDVLKPKTRDIELTFPIIHMSKQDIIKSMPKELLDKIWFCRRPKYYDKGDEIVSYRDEENAVYAVPCKIGCSPCKAIFPVFEELGINYEKYFL